MVETVRRQCRYFGFNTTSHSLVAACLLQQEGVTELLS
jgi:hypothetical protein